MIHQLSAIWKYRHFLHALIKLDLNLRYRRSVFGIGWSLLNPIAMTIVFCLVFSSLLGNGQWRTYAPFLLTGMAVWGFLRDAALVGCRSLLNNETYIRQAPLPFGLYSMRTVAGQGIHFLIAMGVTLLMAVVLLPHGFGVLAVVPAVIPGIVMAFAAAWAVATILSFANVYFQDTQHLLDVAAQIMFFLTPIMYYPDVLEAKGLRWMLVFNPVNLYLELIRAPLLSAQVPLLQTYVYGFVLTSGLVGLACMTVAWLQKRVIFHM